LDRRSDDPLEAAADLIFERCDHGVSRFADGDYEYPRVGIEIVQVFADAHYSAVAADVAGEGTINRGVFESVSKDLARNLTHLSELLVA
jgi:hypothetical protein